MKKSKKIYNLINIFFLLISFLFIDFHGFNVIKKVGIQLIPLTLLILIIHVLKFCKLYSIVLEDRVSIKRMLKLYIKSTFVSIILPYKTGEIYKAYLLGYELNSYAKGIVAVVIDKFFDALILGIILISYSLYYHTSLSVLGCVLLFVVVACILLYYLFINTYYYLNRFFISGKQAMRNKVGLSLLEYFYEFYLKVKEMIRGRGLILTVLGCLYWLGEIIFIFISANVEHIEVSFRNVVGYINDAFLGMSNSIFNLYIYICVFIFVITLIIIYNKKYLFGGNKNEKSISDL